MDKQIIKWTKQQVGRTSLMESYGQDKDKWAIDKRKGRYLAGLLLIENNDKAKHIS